MKVLVTGGAGFIGSHTVDLLIEKGHQVRIFDKLEEQVHGDSKPNYLNKKAEFMSGDILDKNQWSKALSGMDAVVHLAAMVGTAQSMYQPSRYLLANTVGTANMFEVILENQSVRSKIKKIVTASSKSIYGEGSYMCSDHGTTYPGSRPIPQLEKKDWEVRCPKCNKHMKPIGITEEKPVQNLLVYALSKYDTERMTLMFGDVLKIPSISFRYFNVYGPRQSLSNPYTGVAAIFLSRVKNNNPPIIYEDGKQSRDFIYVEDIARANVAALEEGDHTDVYNLGAGEMVSVEQIARTLIKLNEKDIEPTMTNTYRPGDNRHDFADITKVKKQLGFRPKWSLKDGMEKLIEWSDTVEAVDKFDQAEMERRKFIGGG